MASPVFTFAQANKHASTRAWLHRQLIGKTPHLRPEDIKRVAGKTAIVTGANAGLGLEVARQLLAMGLSKLILGVRIVSEGEKARDELLTEVKHNMGQAACSIEVWELDMISYDSVVHFAKRAEDTLDRVDIAVLNAGTYREEERFTHFTGYEEDIQVNYLSTVLLAVLLLPRLKPRSINHQEGRMVIVTSDMSKGAKFTEKTESPLLPVYKRETKNWNHAERYSTSKLLAQLFLYKLVAEMKISGVVITMANPGMTYGTRLVRDGDGRLIGMVYKMGFRLLGKPLQVGALSIMHAAISFGRTAHGHYTEDGEIRPYPAILYTAEGREVAKKLWDETLEEFSFVPVYDLIDGLT